jgi:hypothetical protein
LLAPASWQKIIIGMTDDRRESKPPKKSALL